MSASKPHSELVEFIDSCERAGEYYGFGSDEFFASARVSAQNLVEQLETTEKRLAALVDTIEWEKHGLPSAVSDRLTEAVDGLVPSQWYVADGRVLALRLRAVRKVAK